MAERAVLLTGIGGQGVQLAARVLGEAALHDGREVQLFASYGGMMRGGNTDATVVVGDDPVGAPPVVGRAWAVVGMHHAHLADPLQRLDDDGVLLVNDTVVADEHLAARLPVSDGPASDRPVVLRLACTDVAAGVGNPMAGALVAVGALAGATGLVSVDGLTAAVGTALPSYRRRHIDSSIAAVQAGAASGLVGPPAWTAVDA